MRVVRNKTCVFIFFFLVSCGISAQEKPTKYNMSVGFVGMQGWRGLTNINNVNTVFSNAGYPSLNSTMSLTEAGVGFWINQLYVLAIGSNCTINKNSSTDFTTSLSGDGFDLVVGYNLIRSEKIRLYPYVGVGYQNIVIDIDPAFPSTYANLLSFKPNLSSIRTTVSKHQTGSIGVGFDYVVASLFNQTSKLSLFFMGGYVYGGGGTWRINDQLATSPTSSFSGINARLGIQLFFKL
ncbi:MAG: hypothetical protein ACKO13_17410 [Cytophagales bacterium]